MPGGATFKVQSRDEPTYMNVAHPATSNFHFPCWRGARTINLGAPTTPLYIATPLCAAPRRRHSDTHSNATQVGHSRKRAIFNALPLSHRSQLPSGLFNPIDNWKKKLSQQVLLHFSVGMGTYVCKRAIFNTLPCGHRWAWRVFQPFL